MTLIGESTDIGDIGQREILPGKKGQRFSDPQLADIGAQGAMKVFRKIPREMDRMNTQLPGQTAEGPGLVTCCLQEFLDPGHPTGAGSLRRGRFIQQLDKYFGQ